MNIAKFPHRIQFTKNSPIQRYHIILSYSISFHMKDTSHEPLKLKYIDTPIKLTLLSFLVRKRTVGYSKGADIH